MYPRKHRFIAVGLAAGLLFAAAGCGSSDSNTSTGSGDGGGGGKTLKVCTDSPYEPFESPGKGPRNLKFTGFDIELLDAMAENLGDTLSIKDSDFKTIFASVNAGNCDIVASAVTITPEREKNSLFTKPYFDADQSLLVKEDSSVKTLDELSGKTIGVQSSTTGETYAKDKAKGAKVKSFPDASGLFAAINAGQIDAILQDLPVNSDRATKDKTVKVVATFKTGEQYGFVVAKDNKDLQGELDKALKAIRDDGTYDKIYKKYFPNAGG